MIYVNKKTGEKHIITTKNAEKIYSNNPNYEILKPKKVKKSED